MSANTISSPLMEKLTSTFESMPWENSKFYKNWLAQSYYYTTHSTRMLAFAAGWCKPSEQGLYRRSLQHIKEEQSHDLIAVRDLENLGEQITNYQELGVTRALWEPQFVKMQREPSALLGYILALEELAVHVLPKLHTKLQKHYGEKAGRFVQIHADEDPGHVKEAVEQIEKRSPAEREEIMKNYDQTCVMYRLMLEEINALV